MTRMVKIRKANTYGHGTDAYKIFQWLLNPARQPDVRHYYIRHHYGVRAEISSKPDTKAQAQKVDRVIILSDMQCWDGSGRMNWYGAPALAVVADEYRKKVNQSCWIHSVDLAGYGTTQFDQSHKRVSLIAGWSDRILEFIAKAEAGATAVDEIARMSLSDFE
jgi:hypothetical protein